MSETQSPFEILAEFTQFFVVFFYEWMKAIVKALAPPGVWPKKSVTNKRVLITGAGSGLGKSMSFEFAKLGAQLILVDVNKNAIDSVRKSIVNNGGKASAYVCNLADKDAIKSLGDQILKEHSGVDILINNAGVVSGGALTTVSEAKIQLTMDVNINAHFWLLKSFLPGMTARDSGHVVTVASGAGHFGCADLVDYCSSKFAAVGMAESLTLETHAKGLYGIKHTCICPYFINTGMFDGVTTRFPRVLPILEQDYAISKIMDAILTEQQLLMMPRILYVLLFVKSIMPVTCGLMMADITGVSKSMQHFTGRNNKNK